MANNRMYLIFKPTGQRIMLAKRMGQEWYVKSETLEADLDAFFETCYVLHCETPESHPDDFEIQLEIPVSANTPQAI